MSARQDGAMARVLGRLEMLSHGAVQAWNPSGGHSGEPDDRMVTTVLRFEEPPHLIFRRWYLRAKTDDYRQWVIDNATEFVEAWKTRQDPVDSKSDVELILEDEGKSIEWLALQWNWAPRKLRELRMNDGRDPESGQKVLGEGGLSTRAAAFRRRGLTQTQIGVELGISQPTVHRLLKEADDAKFRRGV